MKRLREFMFGMDATKLPEPNRNIEVDPFEIPYADFVEQYKVKLQQNPDIFKDLKISYKLEVDEDDFFFGKVSKKKVSDADYVYDPDAFVTLESLNGSNTHYQCKQFTNDRNNPFKPKKNTWNIRLNDYDNKFEKALKSYRDNNSKLQVLNSDIAQIEKNLKSLYEALEFKDEPFSYYNLFIYLIMNDNTHFFYTDDNKIPKTHWVEPVETSFGSFVPGFFKFGEGNWMSFYQKKDVLKKFGEYLNNNKERFSKYTNDLRRITRERLNNTSGGKRKTKSIKISRSKIQSKHRGIKRKKMKSKKYRHF